ncbi:LysR substrate-binding domain-containing protein, partial [Streptomyces sp. NPDC056290]
PLLVDLNSPGLRTPRQVLHRARELMPGHELMARYESGLTWAAAELLAGRLDASFGRFAGLAPALRSGLAQQPVRYEPMAVVLPVDHPLAPLTEVPLASLAGETVYAGAGNPRTPEWTDLARQLFQGRGITLAPPAPLAVGEEEFQRVMARTRHPILAVVDFPPLPSTVLRPLVDPVPLSPVSLVWRKGIVHPALEGLRRAAAAVGAERDWLRMPEEGWIPASDSVVMAFP